MPMLFMNGRFIVTTIIYIYYYTEVLKNRTKQFSSKTLHKVPNERNEMHSVDNNIELQCNIKQ